MRGDAGTLVRGGGVEGCFTGLPVALQHVATVTNHQEEQAKTE